MKSSNSVFAWGDIVRARRTANKRFRPGSTGDVCGICEISDPKIALRRGYDVGTVLVLVEFHDGDALEIPEESLEMVEGEKPTTDPERP
jgi:hypothetical protein